MGLCVFLLRHNPGGEVVKDRAKEAHDSLLDFFVSRKVISSNKVALFYSLFDLKSQSKHLKRNYKIMFTHNSGSSSIL